jgi:uncharacterized Zn finger protein
VAEDDAAPTAGALGTATLFCDSCGRETVHRVLRLDRGPARPRAVAGVARCRECRWTHRFVSSTPATVRLGLVVSRGGTSERHAAEVDPSAVLRVGERLPGSAVVVRRIDRADGAPVPSALAREARTVWAVEEGPPTVRLAIVAGARSSTQRVPAAPGLRLTVGEAFPAAGGPVTIVALRARHRTWRRPGDAFRAEEVSVVYGRRTVSPPAGRRPWRADRGTPSSRARSISASFRPRSSPGRRRKRTAPRARIADGGATERNSSRS